MTKKRKTPKPKPRARDGSHFVCKCECGGNVRGVRDMGRLWTWCDKCTPVQRVDISKLRPH